MDRDAKKKRDVIKKVIAYMTLGIDVSRLFTEMIMCVETRDLVVKKMVYHYLCTYAHEQPELGLMRAPRAAAKQAAETRRGAAAAATWMYSVDESRRPAGASTRCSATARTTTPWSGAWRCGASARCGCRRSSSTSSRRSGPRCATGARASAARMFGSRRRRDRG